MVRPRKNRSIQAMPVATFYKPRGIALNRMKSALLPVEGFEAIRLVDAEGIPRREAARMMNVSPATLCRILQEARTVIAQALANGWALKIEGGDYQLVDDTPSGPGKQGRHGGRCHGHGRRGNRRTTAQACPSRTMKQARKNEHEEANTQNTLHNMEVEPCQDKMEEVRKEMDQ